MGILEALKKAGLWLANALFEIVVFGAVLIVALPFMVLNHTMYWLAKAFWFFSGKAPDDYFKTCAYLGEKHYGKGCVFVISNHLVSFIRLKEKEVNHE